MEFSAYIKKLRLTNHPLKVRFKKRIFEDDYVEEGMIGYLTRIEKDSICYLLVFSMGDFYDHNKKLMKRAYYPNIHTTGESSNGLFTAIEAGCYTPEYSVYFGDVTDSWNTTLNELSKHIEILEE